MVTQRNGARVATKPMVEYALAYAKIGWRIVLVHYPRNGGCSCGNPACDSPGKHPMIAGWQHKATTNEETIRGWFEECPDANIGYVPDEDMAVLDDDPAHGGNKTLGFYEPLPKTVESATGGGGSHHTFSLNGHRIKNSTGKEGVGLGPGLDVKTVGGLIILPPSLHRSGKRYSWVNKPSKTDIADFPEDMLQSLSQNGRAERFNTAAALEGVQEGQRDDTIFRLACKLRQEDVPLAEAEQKVLTAAGNCSPPFPEDEALAKVKTVYETYPAGKLSASRRTTEFANGERFAAQYVGVARYNHLWKKWLVYDGIRWRADDTAGAERLAKKTVRSIYREAALEEEDKDAARLAGWAFKSESQARIKTMLSLAASEPGMSILADDLDGDLWAFNAGNGTIDLHTGELHEHSADDLITKLAPVKYDPDAKAPVWLAFLDRIMDGRQELVDFVQRAVGYSLTGDTNEQVLFMLIGDGANGKSTFIEALLALLGDYGGVAAPGMLLTSRGDRHPTEVAAMHGKRLVSSMEVGEGRRFREELVKQLTGGDTIMARRMHEDFWSFLPTHKLWITANYKPQIRGTDLAIWRRIRLIPFDVTIPPTERDKTLPAKLRGELPGILAWAVKGCLNYRAGGLEPPKAVLEATGKYRRESDPLLEFVADRCKVDDAKAEVRAGELYAAYKSWAGIQGISDREVLDSKRFGAEMARRFEPGRDKRGRVYKGVRLRAIGHGI